MMTQLPNDLQLDNDFWQFSLSLWQNKTAQETLLRLQDTQHVRINLLLFSMWLGMEKKHIAPHMTILLETTESWHQQVVGPLRHVRKSLSSLYPTTGLKPQVQSSELFAEQIEQSLLFHNALKIQAIPSTIDKNHSSDNTLTILIENLLASANHPQSMQQLDTLENQKNKNIDRLNHSDLLLLVQACLPVHPEPHIKACINLLINSQ